jgi:hypothetical protein
VDVVEAAWGLKADSARAAASRYSKLAPVASAAPLMASATLAPARFKMPPMSMSLLAEHDPEKLRTFRTRSCVKTKLRGALAKTLWRIAPLCRLGNYAERKPGQSGEGVRDKGLKC